MKPLYNFWIRILYAYIFSDDPCKTGKAFKKNWKILLKQQRYFNHIALFILLSYSLCWLSLQDKSLPHCHEEQSRYTYIHRLSATVLMSSEFIV